MNSLIYLHDKYHLNENRETINLNNNNSSFPNNLIDLEMNNDDNSNSEKKNDLFGIDKKANIEENIYNINKEKSNINYDNNNNNNRHTFNLTIKNNDNILLDSDKKLNNESLFHSFKRPCKRNYLELLSQNIYINNNNNNSNDNKNNTIINLNINNNNYYYINNSNYNISSEEKYGIDFSKKKTLKKF